MITLKLSDFRPAYKHQVNFYHLHKNQVNRSPQKNQVNFDPYIKTKYFSAFTQNEVNFDPRTNSTSILYPH